MSLFRQISGRGAGKFVKFLEEMQKYFFLSLPVLIPIFLSPHILIEVVAIEQFCRKREFIKS